MERALLVTIKLDSEKNSWKIEDMAAELEELAHTCRAEVVNNIWCQRDKPTANFFIGKGKAEELVYICQEEKIDTVIFSHDFSGTQQRNLEELIGKKTIDRTQLILDIFAQHAKTPEGKMQVELAQLQYLLPRLVGKGVILSRLGGGIGTRGPGEQKLEVDRRVLRKRIEKLKGDLKHLSLHRATLRKKRKENATPTAALVGYTSAGKSTLLNTLTNTNQPVRESLFTTLDPISRILKLTNGQNIVISDTVGFLNNLPHHLVEAFKATLEEVQEADLLVHVLDVGNSLAHERQKAVAEVLKELEVENKPIITALNKIDLIDDKSWLHSLSKDFVHPVFISAKFKQGINVLLEKIQEYFQPAMVLWKGLIPYSRMELVDLFYRQGRVEKIEYQQKGIKITANIPKSLLYNLLKEKEISDIS
ncbi:MAG: GTPase HflX [Omnitrophica WOR_2 bacterium RBG_13_41_10]|nr:MAG: GTPase HflX [Omnitrophica WOR_2 bacterium RBG_13_41_10]